MRKPRTWIMAVTYAPKVEGVKNGTIRQTIRAGWKRQVGDRVILHGWEGKPYRSRWSWRRYETLREVIDIRLARCDGKTGYRCGPGCVRVVEPPQFTEDWNDLARRDGIVPPSGGELGRILTAMHGLDETPMPVQVLRW